MRRHHFTETGRLGLVRQWRRQGRRRSNILYGVMMATGLYFLCQPALAIQKETTTEKAENLEKQVKGGLFNFWTFDRQASGTLPEGFVSAIYGEGSKGMWTIEAVPTAPSSPNAVAAVSDCVACSQLLIAQGLQYEYPDLSVRLHWGQGEGNIGILFGLKDPMNFYAVLVDLPGKTLRIVRVSEGKEFLLGEAPLKAKPVEWHTLRVQRNTIISKDFIETFFDGQITLSVEDKLLGLGQIGLLVRGNVSVHFDTFNAAPLYSHRPLSPPAAY